MEKDLLEIIMKKKNCKKQESKFRVEKKKKKTDVKLYLQCKGFDISFNSWIDKKDIII